MSGEQPGLEGVTEAALTLGLLASGALMLGGLLAGSTPTLRGGILLLMLTPVARVLVLTTALLYARDWLFGLISLWVLAVLASGIYMASRM